jgi:hypothetical protein
MQTIKSLELQKILAWTLLIIAVVEWFPFFMQVLLNFFNMNLREIPSQDIVLVLAPIFSPLVTLVYGILGWRDPSRFKKYSVVIAIAGAITCIIFNWLCMAAYYQYYGVFTPDLSDIGAKQGVFGLIGYLNPVVQTLLYWTNGIMFYGLIPALFNVATGGTSRIQYSHELNFAALIVSVYMFLRPGSIAGTPFRYALILLVVTATWLVLIINGKQINKEILRDSNFFIDSDAIPKVAENGIALILGFSALNFAISANGLPINTWAWLFLTASTGIIALLILTNKKITSLLPGIIVFTALVAVECIVIWADINAILLSIEPWLQGAGLFLLGLLFPASLPFLSTSRTNRYLKHPGRMLFFNLITVASFLLPLIIIATFPPISTIIGILLVSIVGAIGLLGLLVPYYKKK